MLAVEARLSRPLDCLLRRSKDTSRLIIGLAPLPQRRHRPGLKLAEWPERAVGLLPVCDLRIAIMLSESHGADAHSDTHREVRIEARTPLGVELLSGP